MECTTVRQSKARKCRGVDQLFSSRGLLLEEVASKSLDKIAQLLHPHLHQPGRRSRIACCLNVSIGILFRLRNRRCPHAADSRASR
jgi:hypothetical protein